MPYINLWLEIPGQRSKKMLVDSEITVSGLKNNLLSQSNLSTLGPRGDILNYRVVRLERGEVLMNEDIPVSDVFKEGDRVSLRAVNAGTDIQTARPEVTRSVKESGPLPGSFSLTGIPPTYLDFSKEYPVLALQYRKTSLQVNGMLTRSKSPVSAKDLFFLIGDSEGRFTWISQSDASYFVPGVRDHEEYKRKLRRYSLNKRFLEDENVIYPVRPFSITGIEMEGFNPGKAYPVLAIDVDKYMKEGEVNEETGEPEQPQEASMGFFLVGDDNGEFAWIAEDECRLAPLDG